VPREGEGVPCWKGVEVDHCSDEFFEAMAAYLAGEDEKAFGLMSQCARAGEVLACVQLVNWCRDEGFADGSEEDARFWQSQIEEMAAAGNAQAQRQLGHWLQRAA